LGLRLWRVNLMLRSSRERRPTTERHPPVGSVTEGKSVAALSPRDQEILANVGERKSQGEVAEAMGISLSTVARAVRRAKEPSA
jgi:DNA-directed RNA polymerase specialized sigma24 family protein